MGVLCLIYGIRVCLATIKKHPNNLYFFDFGSILRYASNALRIIQDTLRSCSLAYLARAACISLVATKAIVGPFSLEPELLIDI